MGLKIEMGFFELVEEEDEIGNGFEKGLWRLLWCRNPDILNVVGMRSSYGDGEEDSEFDVVIIRDFRIQNSDLRSGKSVFGFPGRE